MTQPKNPRELVADVHGAIATEIQTTGREPTAMLISNDHYSAIQMMMLAASLCDGRTDLTTSELNAKGAKFLGIPLYLTDLQINPIPLRDFVYYPPKREPA